MVCVRNPLKFWCAPNEATPDYISYRNFRSWVAYGLLACWLSHDDEDPDADCNMSAAFTREDVQELRDCFLDLVETVVVALWKEQYSPGDGSIDGDWRSVIVGDVREPTFLTWRVRLDDDAIMFELDCTGSDGVAIWLDYAAIADRKQVLAVLVEARKTLDGPGNRGEVWPQLVELVELVQE
jgi:hypothetical protein